MSAAHNFNKDKKTNLSLSSNVETFVDQDEIDTKIIRQLNSIFGKDVQNLCKVKDLVEELTVTQNELKDRLLFAASEAPDKITKAIIEAEEALSVTGKLKNEFNEINIQLSELQTSYKDLVNALTPDIREYNYFKRVEIYRKWISNTEELSHQIKFHLRAGNETEVILFYDQLKNSVKVITNSKCVHLTEYCSKLLLYWHDILRNKLEKDVEKELLVIKWPFTSSNASVNSSSIPVEAAQRLEQVLEHLLQLDIPKDILQLHTENKQIENETGKIAPVLLQDFVVTLIPVQLLLRPLEIRFLYHFSGSKATNSRNNPEWYLTQILKWIGAHESFMEERIQPILNRNSITNSTAKVEFMRGLVRLVVLKLLTDLPDIGNNEDLFCQTIQATLNFERELRLGLNYPTSQPSVLAVLTQPSIFNSWITIERKFALELMDEFVSSSIAWKCEDHDDEGGVCHCGEQLIFLLQGIADRYKPLPQPGHRIQFLELQLELLDDFRIRVLQMMKSELSEPLQSNYCSILNTVNHIVTTLGDWSDLPFYIEMQYYREQFNNLQRELKTSQMLSDKFSDFEIRNEDEMDESTMMDSFVSAVALNESSIKHDALHTLNNETTTMSSRLKIVGSVFDEISDLFSRIECEMMSVVTQHVLTEIRARSQSYRKEKWFATPSPQSTETRSVLEVSPSLCILLQVLVKLLCLLKGKLSVRLFTEFWKGIASHLNKFIYEEVILQNNFSEFGAAQLQYDMTKAIFPIFGEYHQKPGIFFSHVKDCLVLLTLPRATALLLKETLKPPNIDKEFCNLVASPVKALQERKVFTLTVEEADIILNIRTNMAC